MQRQRKNSGGALRLPVAVAAIAAVLLLLAGLTWWGYSAHKKREMQAAVVTLVTAATARARDALRAREPGAGAIERLEAHFKSLSEAAQRIAALDGWRDAPLSEAARQYVDEVHALVRRLIARERAREAVLGGTEAISGHLRAARGRSGDWIREAIALRQQLDRDYFDYRMAEGGLEKSLRTLPEARQRLAPLVAGTPLLEDVPIAEERNRLATESAGLVRQVEAARSLPAPR
jgi:hypothetical protein